MIYFFVLALAMWNLWLTWSMCVHAAAFRMLDDELAQQREDAGLS